MYFFAVRWLYQLTYSLPDPKSPSEDGDVVSGSFGRNVSFSGNKIVIQDNNLSSSGNFLDPTRGSHTAQRRSTEITDEKLRK